MLFSSATAGDTVLSGKFSVSSFDVRKPTHVSSNFAPVASEASFLFVGRLRAC